MKHLVAAASTQTNTVYGIFDLYGSLVFCSFFFKVNRHKKKRNTLNTLMIHDSFLTGMKVSLMHGHLATYVSSTHYFTIIVFCWLVIPHKDRGEWMDPQ